MIHDAIRNGLIRASKAASFTPQLIKAAATRAQQAVPSGASEAWIADYAARLSLTGPLLTDQEIADAVNFVNSLAKEFAPPAPTVAPPVAVQPPAPAPLPPVQSIAPVPPVTVMPPVAVPVPEKPPAQPPTVAPPTAEDPVHSIAPVATRKAGGQRYQQLQLFQAAPSQYLASREPGRAPLPQDLSGPNAEWVSYGSGWAWDEIGGDWVDRDGTRYGKVPWFSVATSAGKNPTAYSVDVTAVANAALADGKWFALLLTCPNGNRNIAGRALPSSPTVRINYKDGTTEVLPCLSIGPSWAKTLPTTCADTVPLPAFAEWAKPRGPVRSATLTFEVTTHWSGSDVIHGWLLDPPTAEGETPAYGTGEGLIGSMTFADGTDETAYMEEGRANIHVDGAFSPHIYELGERNPKLLPDRSQGLFINMSEGAQVVPSTWRQDGFVPPAPGLGALRISMPRSPDLKHGAIVGSYGTTSETTMIFLPDELMGRLPEIYIRYYFRTRPIGPYGPDHRVQTQQSLNTWAWSSNTGKIGIGADHSTSWGGVSMTSGGDHGWQMRGGWTTNHCAGPENGALVLSDHLGDFLDPNKCPKEHLYGKWAQPKVSWGRRGLGVVYPNQWYCIERRMRLNSLTPGGYAEDGVLSTWWDGKLVVEHSNMVFRTGPGKYRGAAPNLQNSCRTLGVRGLWLNWFGGGRTWTDVPDQVHFYSAIAYGKNYIGPLRT